MATVGENKNRRRQNKHDIICRSLEHTLTQTKRKRDEIVYRMKLKQTATMIHDSYRFAWCA